MPLLAQPTESNPPSDVATTAPDASPVLSQQKSVSLEQLSHEIYENTIPTRVVELLEEIYNNPYCSADFQRIYYPTEFVHSIVIKKDNIPVHALLFSLFGNSAVIHNRVFGIERIYVNYASSVIFKKYKTVKKVIFSKISYEQQGKFNFPNIVPREFSDIIIPLPKDTETYHNNLGKQTRKHLKQYIKRLEQSYQYRFEVRPIVNDSDQAYLRQIINFNKARMVNKGTRPYTDGEQEQKLIKYATTRGLLGLLFLDNQLAAGSILSLSGKQAFLDFLTHDPKYDRFNLGNVCLFFTIKYCIGINKQNVHLLWGTVEYKRRFLGKDKKMVDLTIFRNRFFKLLAYPRIFKIEVMNIFRFSKDLVFDKLASMETTRKMSIRFRQLFHGL
jgi:hypothetical protein